MLDVLCGTVIRVAESTAELSALTSEPTWRKQFLPAGPVKRLHRAGKIAEGHDCYAIAPHPALGDRTPCSANGWTSASSW